MNISVRINKVESLDFDAAGWYVDESGYLNINDEDASAVATFAPGVWRYVTDVPDA